MARAQTTKLYRTFVKGLITEASPLTYPEDASIDELNTVLSRKGNRTRRRGIRYEESHKFANITFAPYDAVNEYVWHSVGKVAGKAVLAVQIGSTIHFWEMDSVPISDRKLSFTIDLVAKKIPTANGKDVATNLAQFASGAGYLFIAHPFCEPQVVEYDKDAKTYKAINVLVQMRDLEGINDNLANDQEPPTLTKEHHYNLLNQGWLAPGTIPAPALGAGEAYNPGSTSSGGSSSGPAPGSGGTYYNPYTGQAVTYIKGAISNKEVE